MLPPQPPFKGKLGAVFRSLVAPLLITSSFEHPSEKTPADQDDSQVTQFAITDEQTNAYPERKPSTTECGSQAYHLMVLRYNRGRLTLFSACIPALPQRLLSPSYMCIEYDGLSR